MVHPHHVTSAHPVVWISLINWQACGIGLAFGGSIVLALGLLSTPLKFALRMSRSGNSNLWQNVQAAENRADAQTGVLGLVAGFGIQAAATVWTVGHGSPPLSRGWSYLVTVAWIVLPAAAMLLLDRKTRWFWMRPYLASLARYDRFGTYSDNPNVRELAGYGRVIGEGREQIAGESDEDYLGRVWKIDASKHQADRVHAGRTKRLRERLSGDDWIMRRLRFWIVLVGTMLVLGSIAAIAAVWGWDVKFGLPHGTDKVTRINTIVAATAYLAAIVAAIFALIAYWQTSGLPSFRVEIVFRPSNSATPAFTATPRQAPPWVDASCAPIPSSYSQESVPILDRTSSETILTVVVTNTAKYAARNPGVRIHFDGLLYNAPPSGWTSAERWGEKNGQKAIQWDGGTENIIHGKWSRTLPDVGFGEVAVISDTPTLVITVVADGCDPKPFDFPLNVTVVKPN